MAEIPDCPLHEAQCIPHAIEGVQKERETMTASPTWEQKFEALQGLGEASLKMRAPGKWYVSQPGVEVKGIGEHSGDGNGADGATPEKAVENRWEALTSQSLEQFVEHKRGRLLRRVRWTGWFWTDIHSEGADA
ncbi:MAG: hypothetical protein ACRD3G_12120 [Vicinamibacterales bacterium]